MSDFYQIQLEDVEHTSFIISRAHFFPQRVPQAGNCYDEKVAIAQGVPVRAARPSTPSPARRLDRSSLKDCFVRSKHISSVRFDWLWGLCLHDGASYTPARMRALR